MKKFTLILLTLFSSFLLGGCFITNKISELFGEKITETAIEQATDGEADVDVDYDENGGITYKSDEGEWSVGSKAEIPNDFPEDMPIIDYNEIVSSSSFQNEEDNESSFTIVVTSNESFEDSKSYYTTRMEQNGWNKVSELDSNGASMLSYEKGENTSSIWINEDEEGVVSVTITVVVRS